jgi:release factor glutamine methyltransferase
VTIAEALAEAAASLASGGVADAPREAASLMMFSLGVDRSYLFAHPERDLTPSELANYVALVKRRIAREPFQHITGTQEFYGIDFAVSPDVLIPRPETEILVEEALRIIQTNGVTRFAEIGIGSGCISISILANSPDTTAIAGDISSRAIAVATANAERLGVADRLTIIESDVFGSFPNEAFGLVVSNPPYIPAAEIPHLQPEVGLHEPRAALTDESDGLSIIERIVHDAPRYLAAGGCLLMEVGWDQSERVRGLFREGNWTSVEFLPDLQGIPRIARAVRSRDQKYLSESSPIR